MPPPPPLPPPSLVLVLPLVPPPLPLLEMLEILELPEELFEVPEELPLDLLEELIETVLITPFSPFPPPLSGLLRRPRFRPRLRLSFIAGGSKYERRVRSDKSDKSGE